MAEKRKTKKDPSALLEGLKQDIKNDELNHVYIFYGEESYLRDSYLAQMQKKLIEEGFEEFNFHRLSGKGLEMQELVEAVEAFPMMAEHTLVTVTDLDLFKLQEGARQMLMDMMADFPEYCTLVFVYDHLEYKRDGKMKKLCAAIDTNAKEVEFWQQERRLLQKWVQRHVAETGHDIDSMTIDHLLFTCGSMMTNLAPEIAKIGAYAKGQNITIADINAVADPILDARAFDMTNSITAGKYDDATRIMGELLRMQEDPIAILAAIGRELRRLYTARIALDENKDKMWLKNLWNMSSDYPAQLLLNAARKTNTKWCKRAVQECQKLDRRMKSEYGINREAELKLFIAELAVKE